MRNWWLIGLLAFPLVFGVSCKKDNPTITLEGVISNSSTGAPVANAEVQILVQELKDNTLNSNFNTVATITTGANGTYTSTFDAHNATEYKIRVEAENYIEQEISINPDNLTRNATNSYGFGLSPIGWYTLKLKNLFPVGNSDNIIYQLTSEQLDCPSCCSRTALSLTGMNVDSTLTCKTIADQYLVANWFVTKNGNTTTHTDSVFVNLGDTASLTVHY